MIFRFSQVRATTDRKRTASSPSSSAPATDVRQEMIYRIESHRALKGLKNDTVTSDSKVEKDVLADILTELGQVGSALKACLTRLTGSTVTDVAKWVQERKERDALFSGLSHFSPVETDNGPGQIYADSEVSSARTHDKMYERESASSKTNNSKASSTRGKGQGSIAGGGGGSVTSSARGSGKGGSGKSNKSIEKLKAVQNATALKLADSRVDTRRPKMEKSTSEDFQDDTDADVDVNRRRRNVLSPVPELSQSSSGYSSSPALSDSEEEEDMGGRGRGGGGGKYNRDIDDSESDSGDDMRIGGLPQGMGSHGVNTIYEDDEDDEYSSEGSPLTPPAPPSSHSTHPSTNSAYTPGHLNSYPQHSNASASAVTKAEGELAKIEEEDELYSDTNDENDDDDGNNDNYNGGDDEEDDDDDEEDGQLFLSNTHNTQVPTPVWRDWTDALSVGSRDRNWLMKSLLLISELCRGNFRAQKKSAHFLPPELLLSLLQSGKLSDQNRSVSQLINQLIRKYCCSSIVLTITLFYLHFVFCLFYFILFY